MPLFRTVILFSIGLAQGGFAQSQQPRFSSPNSFSHSVTFSLNDNPVLVSTLTIERRSQVFVEVFCPATWLTGAKRQVIAGFVHAGKHSRMDDDRDIFKTKNENVFEGREFAEEHLRYWFVLYPGMYRLYAGLEDQDSENEDQPPQTSTDGTGKWIARIKVTPLNFDRRLILLNRWLRQTHIDRDLEIVSLYPSVSRSELPDAVGYNYARTLNRISLEREFVLRKDTEDTGDFDPFEGAQDLPDWFVYPNEDTSGNVDLPKWAHRDQMPVYLLSLRPKSFRLRTLEESFRRSNDSLWAQILRKLAISLNVPTDRIVLHLEQFGECSVPDIFEDQMMPGKTERFGPGCPLIVHQSRRIVRPSGPTRPEGKSLSGDFDLSRTVPPFLKQFLPSGASVQYLEQTAGFTVLIVRNLRGHVIRGGRDWEKLYLAIAITKDDIIGPELHVVADGSTSSGLGGYPPDSQFTTSMEPAHAGALVDYIDSLLNELSRHLE